MGLIDDLDKRREISARHRENSGRLAQAFAEFETTGAGSHQVEERVGFGLLFVTKPVPSHMCEIDMEELEELLGTESPTLPQVTAYVSDWDTDDRGLYTGCWVAMRVDFAITSMIDPSVAVTILHHFTFNGVGLKDVTPESTV